MPSIVCAIDSDVLRSVKRGASNGRLALYDARRASYDASVVQALQRIGFAFQLVGVKDQFSRSLSEIEALNPELVFNLALSATPSESAFVDGLASRELAYTGSGSSAITATNDKIRMRRLLKKFNIPIPKYSLFYPKRRPRSLGGTSPHIVKPAKFGATSDGIKPSSMVWTYEQACKQADRIATTLGGTANHPNATIFTTCARIRGTPKVRSLWPPVRSSAPAWSRCAALPRRGCCWS